MKTSIKMGNQSEKVLKFPKGQCTKGNPKLLKRPFICEIKNFLPEVK